MAKVTYNERSWAIDVISSIEVFLSNKSWNFKGAGGENTIKNNKKSLFPDVLLFKDASKNIIVHGWELKMPDTEITDAELISNAKKKAKILNRDSFILWNVKNAVLYHKHEEDFEILKSWDAIDISRRNEVKEKELLWKGLLFEILADLNSYFESGKISQNTSTEILSIDDVIDVILENNLSTIDSFRAKVKSDSILEAKINQWWEASFSEYGIKEKEKQKYKLPILANIVLTDWVFKIVFAHILKIHFNEAKEIENIQAETSIEDATSIITSISQNCNFWNIFSSNLGQNGISENAWNDLKELNLFLSSVNVEAIDIEILHELLQNSIASAKRKVAGQYSTPKKLAELLNRLTINDKSKIVFDPCCGTGTIINEAYKLKEEYEFSQEEILNSIWASDKHSFPIQLATLSMAKPTNVGKIINIFSSDVIDLTDGKLIEFRNPNNGEIVKKKLPKIDYVVSNLPFIKNKEIKVLNPEIYGINNWIQDETNSKIALMGKSDMFAYIPFYLHRFLSEEGRIGLILSNAWMGTDYGELFLKAFRMFYNVNHVVISGKGKWFKNAEVVTTLLIASKKKVDEKTDNSSEVSFCTLEEKVDEVADTKLLSENIILSSEHKNLKINKYSLNKIHEFEKIGVPWSAYFSDLTWLPKITSKIIKSNKFFTLIRGERRGWNALFYPASGHNIEEEYLKPILKDLKSTKGLVSRTNKTAFCCPKSIEELEKLNHSGTLKWIKSFSSQSNNSGIPLPKVLKKANSFWYEMKSDSLADFVANVNYDKTLFIAKFDEPTFIDQRMIGFSLIKGYQKDKELLLALLNSTLGMFFIEGYGFGRGMGALDLRAKKISRDFNVLNPDILSDEQKEEIVEAFLPLLARNRLPLLEELQSADRIRFDSKLMKIYEITEYFESIKSSLLHLYRIRFAVKDI